LTLIEEWIIGAVYVHVTMTKGVIVDNDEWTCVKLDRAAEEVTLLCNHELFRVAYSWDYCFTESAGHEKVFEQWQWYRRFRLFKLQSGKPLDINQKKSVDSSFDSCAPGCILTP
jgi:hypothetical protein